MISCVVLTHNDEAILARCLQSLAFCDEVVVIDDASTDKTQEIAKKAGAKVFVRQLADDFAKQRNFGLSKAKHEWVLFVDSDEVVSPQLAKEIQEAKSACYIKRRDFMWGRELKHGEMGNMKLLRFAKKDAGKWERPIHEVWNVKGTVAELKNPLLHYPHPNVAQFLDEINRYSTLNARYLHSQGIKASWWQILAYPKAKFLLNYFWHLGFLDGTAGAVYALMMSFHSFLTRGKLYVLWKGKKMDPGPRSIPGINVSNMVRIWRV